MPWVVYQDDFSTPSDFDMHVFGVADTREAAVKILKHALDAYILDTRLYDEKTAISDDEIVIKDSSDSIIYEVNRQLYGWHLVAKKMHMNTIYPVHYGV